ncbi:hypothetical protein E4T56_gene7268 [Termitomyces sp. T112]|nr:hypothetical protein E4T56_gene7268 [Termitomyces sp. T112]
MVQDITALKRGAYLFELDSVESAMRFRNYAQDTDWDLARTCLGGLVQVIDAYTFLDVASPNVMAVHFNRVNGHLALFNIYNDCQHNNSLSALSSFLNANLSTVCPSDGDHMLWLGDFNRHHPLWKTVDNHHLNSLEEDIHPLLRHLGTYHMELALSVNADGVASQGHS